MKILLTGASSFTGFWFVKNLAQAGHEVVCALTGDGTKYAAGRRIRVDQLRPLSRLATFSPFGSENFIRLAEGEKFDLLCHHGADVTHYKSPDFDALRALQNNSHNLRQVLRVLACPVVLTGSVFEFNEGAGDEPLRAFSPYGLSKGLTDQTFRFYCQEAGQSLGKFVIPNPFGPFEEPRFTAFLMKNWQAGVPAEVKTPDYLRDNIPVDLLASAYVQFAETTVAARQPFRKLNPSGYIEKQGEFARRVARETKARLGWACELILSQQEEFTEPRHRTNTDPARDLVPQWDEAKAWDSFAGFYRERPDWPSV
jgi:nucleoside-diphosphate-sugar epimerase